MKFAVFEQIKKSLESVKRYALGEIGNVANATVEAVEEIAGELNNKADKPHYITVVIPTEGWLSDDFDYPNYYDIVVEGITENDRADILFLPESMKTAAECGFCNVTETLEGKIRVRAMSVPKKAITTEIRFNTNCDAVNIEGVTIVELQNGLNQKANVLHSHSADSITSGTIDGNITISGSVSEGYVTVANPNVLKIETVNTSNNTIIFDTAFRNYSTTFNRLIVNMTLIFANDINRNIYTIKSIDITNHSIIVNERLSLSRRPYYIVLDMDIHRCMEHAEGSHTIAVDCSHAEGGQTIAEGSCSHAEGGQTIAEGSCSHAEGTYTTATGFSSHAEGTDTQAKGDCSHAGGYRTIANDYQTTIGKFNIDTMGGEEQGITGSTFIIGNGTNNSARSNCFRVQYDGGVYAKAAYHSSGADYAEYFQWKDDNTNNEDRVGLFVTLDGEKISIAKPNDDILGIVSACPSICGDANEDQWKGMYQTDIYGRPILEEVAIPDEFIMLPDPQNPEKTIKELIREAHTEIRQKVNEDYDTTQQYIPRSKRPEWSAIGLLGKLVVIDDGSCIINGYCKVGEGGIAVISEQKTRFRVMARLDDNHIKILML